MLVLKWLKINCLMLYSQTNKCLVLSKCPHSDPLLTLTHFLVRGKEACMLECSDVPALQFDNERTFFISFDMVAHMCACANLDF